MCLRCPVCGYIAFCHNNWILPYPTEIVPSWSEAAASHYAPDGFYCENVLYLESKERLR